MVDATWLMVALNVPSASLVKVFCLKMASLDSLGKGAEDNGYPREVKPFRKLSSIKFLMCLRNVCHQRHAQHLSSVVVAVIIPSLAPSEWKSKCHQVNRMGRYNNQQCGSSS